MLQRSSVHLRLRFGNVVLAHVLGFSLRLHQRQPLRLRSRERLSMELLGCRLNLHLRLRFQSLLSVHLGLRLGHVCCSSLHASCFGGTRRHALRLSLGDGLGSSFLRVELDLRLHLELVRAFGRLEVAQTGARQLRGRQERGRYDRLGAALRSENNTNWSRFG